MNKRFGRASPLATFAKLFRTRAQQIACLDEPTGNEITPGVICFRGWVAGPDPISVVTLEIGDRQKAISTFHERPDVPEATGAAHAVGWHLYVDLSPRPPGADSLRVRILVAGAGPAFAADIVPARVYKAPPPVYLGWTGLYVGVNGGWYGSTDNTITNIGTDTSIAGLGSALRLGLIPGAVSLSHNGFIGGGQIGYNWQVNPAWVVGIEADFDGVTGGKSSVASSPGQPDHRADDIPVQS